jgi:hypothetical protein
MKNKISTSETNQEVKKKESLFKWYIITIPALIATFVICYALQWVLWKWIWLAIPIWVFFYFITRKDRTDYSSPIIPREVKKYIDHDDFKEWCKQSSKDTPLIISDPTPITFWERLKYKIRKYLP